MSGRSYAGFEYQRRLSAGFYGDVFRAQNSAGHGACILHVVPRLASLDGYVEALARFGSDLTSLSHRNLVITRTVGRELDGTVVVVTDAVVGAVSLEELLASQRGQRPSAPLTLAILTGLIEALALAHKRGVVHGGLHPRSVLIDAAGVVRVDHFAVARALSAIAAANDDADIYEGFRGYLAPELALGEDPTPASDVYALGAIMFGLFGGDVSGGAQPGRLKATTSIRRVVMRAMDTEVSRRFADAFEVRAAWAQALKADSCELAKDSELADYTADARAAGSSRATSVTDDADLDDATEDLLSALSGSEPARDVEDALSSLASELDEDSMVGAEPSRTGDEEPTAIAPNRRRTSNVGVGDVLDSLDAELGPDLDELGLDVEAGDSDALAAVAADLTRPGAFGTEPDTHVAAEAVDDDADHSQLTQVDDVVAHDEIDDVRDPISALIELEKELEQESEVESYDLGAPAGTAESHDEVPPDEDHTPLPPPQVHESGSFTRNSHQILRGKKGSKSVRERAEDAIAGLDDEPEVAPPTQRARSARPIAVDETEFLMHRRRAPSWIYMLVAVIALSGMGYVVYTKSDVFHPERVERRRKEREAEDRAKEERMREKLKRGAEMLITANETGASVWLRLGRTPVDSMPLPNSHPHQLRLELDGFAHDDVIVSAANWTKNKAEVARTLVPAKPGAVVPAWPPRIPDSATVGFPDTQALGIVHVESTPPQAEAWLLVGYTNSVHLRDFEAGVKYEFKILKEGFRPGFAVIEADDWAKLRARDPTAMQFTISRDVELTPLEPAPKPR